MGRFSWRDQFASRELLGIVYEELEDGSSGVKHIWSLDVLAV